jgi:GNAT superfamily N-acetyltransferase
LKKHEATSTRELKLIARLHAESLPNDFLPLLGEKALLLFYDFLDGSLLERCLLAHDSAGGIAGCCVVSLSPWTLVRRFLCYHPMRLVGILCSQLLKYPPLLARAFGFIARRRSPGARIPINSSEIAFLFVRGLSRGTGTGRYLIEQAELWAKEKGSRYLTARTASGHSNSAVAFYQKAGFAVIGSESRGRAQYLMLMKELQGESV